MSQATCDNANLLAASFQPKTLAEIQELCPPGSQNRAHMRTVSYWDMAVSLSTAGVLNPELFFANNREMPAVWVRLRKLLPEMRAACKEFIACLERTSPGVFEACSARVGG